MLAARSNMRRSLIGGFSHRQSDLQRLPPPHQHYQPPLQLGVQTSSKSSIKSISLQAQNKNRIAQWQRKWGLYSSGNAGDGALTTTVNGASITRGGGNQTMALNQLPFFVERKVYGLNLAEICGHASFLVLGLGYLEHDVLKLRVLAATGISLGVIFQYFRPQPLYIPIGWNFLFFGINCCMVALLLKERSDAKENVTDEQRSVHDRLFSKLELTQYMHLIAEAKREVLPPGTVVTRQGVCMDKLYLILGGTADVFIDDEYIGETGEDSFIAEMSFAAYLRDEMVAATADVVVGDDEPMVVLVWDFKELKDFLHKNPETGAPICGTLAHDIALKMNRKSSATLPTRQPTVKLPSSRSSLTTSTSSPSSSPSTPASLRAYPITAKSLRHIDQEGTGHDNDDENYHVHHQQQNRHNSSSSSVRTESNDMNNSGRDSRSKSGHSDSSSNKNNGDSNNSDISISSRATTGHKVVSSITYTAAMNSRSSSANAENNTNNKIARESTRSRTNSSSSNNNSNNSSNNNSNSNTSPLSNRHGGTMALA